MMMKKYADIIREMIMDRENRAKKEKNSDLSFIFSFFLLFPVFLHCSL